MKGKFDWLLEVKEPCVLVEALKYIGIKEFPEDSTNPLIKGWALSLGYPNRVKDSIAWCALFLSKIVRDCGYNIPQLSVKSLNWLLWGEVITDPKPGDILIFKRKRGGHIGLFVDQDETHFYVLGGNQRRNGVDSVNIKRLIKSKCVGIRRPQDQDKIKQDEISEDQKDTTDTNSVPEQ